MLIKAPCYLTNYILKLNLEIVLTFLEIQVWITNQEKIVELAQEVILCDNHNSPRLPT